jgi:hypothetical protein
MTCNHDHDREQQQRFEDDIQSMIDRAYETEKVCELVSALQKTLAGVLACDAIANGGGNERDSRHSRRRRRIHHPGARGVGRGSRETRRWSHSLTADDARPQVLR